MSLDIHELTMLVEIHREVVKEKPVEGKLSELPAITDEEIVYEPDLTAKGRPVEVGIYVLGKDMKPYHVLETELLWYKVENEKLKKKIEELSK